ncbi:MAG: quinohemoprotein amine dehydrogenase subunit alpha [Proteobacteria bacterium]|nr:quinohemoprotein amine dehydrogenase subunit alpha [Pseudomonadota bacterium]
MIRTVSGKAMVVLLSVFLMWTSSLFGKTPFSDTSMVRRKCSACHKLDRQGRVEVIEETRKSPEEWKMVVDRMTRLNDVPLKDKEFHVVVKELSRYLSLTPTEMARISYINSDENSQYREIPKNAEEKRLYTACVRCHTWGKMASHRFTPAMWGEVRVMHLAYYPTAVMQMREMDWPAEFQNLIEPLAKRFPFESSQWREWMKNRNDPDLGGRWQIAGYQPGTGYYMGRYTITADTAKGKDEYRIEKAIRFDNGASMKSNGGGTLYAGYHLRYALVNPATGKETEGVFDLDASQNSFTGRWWAVLQDRNSYGNENAVKDTSQPRIAGVFPQSLRSGTASQEIRLIGVNFPTQAKVSDVVFSDTNIVVGSIKSSSKNEIIAVVEVKKNVANGPVTIKVNNIRYRGPILVFDEIDGIRIYPAIGRARVSSGPAYPVQGVQFVARAVNFGKDGDPGTGDDLILEPVKAKWWLEEEDTSVSLLMKGLRMAGVYPKFGREVDDDLKYLKTGVGNGLYTPITTYGPLKEREQNNQGTGLIAIGASYTVDGKEHKGRSKLAVTVPDFIPHIK